MAPSVRPALRLTLHRAAVTGLALAAVATTITAAAPGAGAAPEARPAAGWAYTVTGQLVKVAPANYATPIHPEAVTHPDADFMGSTIPAHERAAVLQSAVGPDASVPQLPGIDVSAYQGNVDWASVASHIDFAYAKATEGMYYTNPDFTNQYDGPYDNGVIRGSYHFAVPNNSSGTTQADYFVAHGGGWSADGRTLPGALDIEYNPYGAECYGLTTTQLVDWMWDFVNRYASREGAYPVIYSTTNWWTTCTGDYSGFAAYDPLWVANYSVGGGGALPHGWGYYTLWQYADSGAQPGDQDVFNGPLSQLQVLAEKG